jgi:hypothetical protein
VTGRDAWLFLTPEVERLVPALLELADGRGAKVRQEEIEEIICRGDATSWFGYLVSCRIALERGIDARVAPGALHLLALILRDQYLLAPSVHPLSASEDRELRRLEDLVDLTAAPADNSHRRTVTEEGG